MDSERLTIHNVRDRTVGVDACVPLLDGTQRQYVNFDNAASTPSLRPVLDKLNEFMIWYSSVHRGTGFKSQIATEAYDLAHDLVACFVGADLQTNTVIFGKNATEALNKLARRLPLAPGDVILTSLMEPHSNDLPWRQRARAVHVAVNDDGTIDEEDLDRLLQIHDSRVKLVAITGASNVTGCLNPVYRLAEKAHAAGAMILVDAAQLAPHRPVGKGLHHLQGAGAIGETTDVAALLEPGDQPVDAGLRLQLQGRTHLVERRRNTVLPAVVLDESEQLQLALRQHAILPERRVRAEKPKNVLV